MKSHHPIKNPRDIHNKIRRIIVITAVSTLIIAMAVYVLRQSLFFTSRERIGVVWYGQDTIYYSVGLNDNINYSVSYSPDTRVTVPGGYGTYRIGALGKLIDWEHKPEILKKTFSLATSTFVDYYFYPPTASVHYGASKSQSSFLPNTMDILQSQSNASLLDKLYFILLFSNENQKKFRQVTYTSTDTFSKRYKGYFYQKTYRSEQKSVQILYSSRYKSTEGIARILEGNGIRVSDLSQNDMTGKKCVVYESKAPFSKTAVEVARFFQCALDIKKTDIYDILFVLGEREGEWE